MDPNKPLALRLKDAAKALGISARYLWQLTKDGLVPCVRVGSGSRKTILYPIDLLQNWLAAQAQSHTEASRPPQGQGLGTSGGYASRSIP